MLLLHLYSWDTKERECKFQKCNFTISTTVTTERIHVVLLTPVFGPSQWEPKSCKQKISKALLLFLAQNQPWVAKLCQQISISLQTKLINECTNIYSKVLDVWFWYCEVEVEWWWLIARRSEDGISFFLSCSFCQGCTCPYLQGLVSLVFSNISFHSMIEWSILCWLNYDIDRQSFIQREFKNTQTDEGWYHFLGFSTTQQS